MLRYKKYRHLWIPICTLGFFVGFAATAWSQPPCNNTPGARRFITTSPLPQATVGQSYLKQFQVSGTAGTVTYMKGDGSLPPGLSLSAGGMLSGIPTTTGNYIFEVLAKDNCLIPGPEGAPPTVGYSFGGGLFSLIVNQTKSCAPLQITSPSALSPATAGLNYSNQIQATGQAPITYEIISGSLPPGLAMTNAGRISGTSKMPGTYSFMVKAQDNCLPTRQTTTKTLSLAVGTAAPPRITSPSLLTPASVGQSYSTQIAASGITPMTYDIISGSLPKGLTISNAGRISGVPTTDGIYSFTVRVRDNSQPTPQTATKMFTIRVDISISGSVAPLAYSAPSGITTTQALTYTFTAPQAGSTTIVSMQGIFLVGGTQINANNTQISAGITAGRGTATETITVTPSVMKQALSMGSSQITYLRSFSNASGTVKISTYMEIRITSGASADLLITRMQLYFQNRQTVITIKRNDTTLKTYAEINYAGSGLLQGYWEVDGNFLSNVIQTITSGSAITIESPAPPVLPTFSSGSHRIRFVVTKPSQNISFPEISYYVSTEEPKTVEVKKLTPLILLFPNNNGVISYAPITFLWSTREAGVAIYLLEFFLKGEEKTLFSAYTKNPNYRLPEALLKTFFVPGKTYVWRVKGFDNVNNIAAESTQFTFTMGE
jgi:hypothetical protein